MMKKIKGFTLIECLVALALLGIASLTMAQIYATVAQRNRINHLVNTSLVNQIKYAEQYSKAAADVVEIKFNDGNSDTSKNAPHKTTHSTNDNYVTIVKVDPASGTPDMTGKETYSYPVNVYVLKSRDRQDNTLTGDPGDAGYTEDAYNLRYRYVLGIDK